MLSLEEEVQYGPILPLLFLYIDIVHRNPGDTDSAVGSMEQGDGHPALNVAAHSQVGLIPFHRKATGYTFKRILRLYAKDVIHRHDKGG